MVPCDCVVLDGRSHLDTARPRRVTAAPGTALMSGGLNGESQYARMVELVRNGGQSTLLATPPTVDGEAGRV